MMPIRIPKDLLFQALPPALTALFLMEGCSNGPSFVDAQSKAAQQILKSSEIRGGLVVHLACGDGGRTVGLGINGSYLVHGLESDTSAVEDARQEIARRNQEGPSCSVRGP